MRVVVQRVSRAKCIVDNQVVSEIGKGYMLLVGFTHTDTLKEVETLARKINNLRIFEDEFGKINLNIHDVNGEILSISQFTLYADTKKSNRPSFTASMGGSEGLLLFLVSAYKVNCEIDNISPFTS